MISKKRFKMALNTASIQSKNSFNTFEIFTLATIIMIPNLKMQRISMPKAHLRLSQPRKDSAEVKCRGPH